MANETTEQRLSREKREREQRKQTESEKDRVDPPETPNPEMYEGGRQPGNLSADVEAEIRDRGGVSMDANPGKEPGGGKTTEEHLAREKAAEDKSKQ